MRGSARAATDALGYDRLSFAMASAWTTKDSSSVLAMVEQADIKRVRSLSLAGTLRVPSEKPSRSLGVTPKTSQIRERVARSGSRAPVT